jgi:hypothetical protein
MKPQESYSYIPSLKDRTNKIVDNVYKAKIFIDIFFPKIVAPEAMENLKPNKEIR